MIAQIGKAILDDLHHQGAPARFWETETDVEGGEGKVLVNWDRVVCAVIASMREPTKTVIEAGQSIWQSSAPHDVLMLWQRMLDQAGRAGMTDVTNEGTACGEGVVMPTTTFTGGGSSGDVIVDLLLSDDELREIKPLSHWRYVPQGAQPGEPGWQKLGEIYRRVLAELEAKMTGQKLPPALSRAPFPARALRDRPWDISALVEE